MSLLDNFAKYGLLDDSTSPDQPVESPGSGVVGHVLDFLAYLDRPRNALATGVQNVMDEDPSTTFFSGLGEGITGQKETPWVDVFGIPQAQPTDEWLPWLGKSAVQLGLDAVLDPLNLIAPIGRIGKVAEAGAKVADLAAASKWGRAFGVKPSMLHYGDFNVEASKLVPGARAGMLAAEETGRAERARGIMALQNMRRGFTETPKEYGGIRVGDWVHAADRQNFGQVEEIGDKTAKVYFVNKAEGTSATVHLPLDQLKSLTKELPTKAQREAFEFPPNLIEAFERPGKEALGRRYEGALQPLLRMKEENDALFAHNNNLFRELELKPRTDITEPITATSPGYRQFSRIIDPRRTVQEGGTGQQLAAYSREAKKGLHREIYRWEDDQGRALYKGFGPEIDSKSPIQWMPVDPNNPAKGMRLEHVPTGTPVEPAQLSLKEARNIAKDRQWVGDPFDAMTLSRQRMIREKAFLEFAVEGRNRGFLARTERGIPDGWEDLSKIGLEGWAAPKPVVGRMAQLSNLLYDTDHVLGKFDEVAKYLGNTVTGQVLKGFRGTWARSNLLSFGFHFNNGASNMALAYLSGIPAHRLLQRAVEGMRVQRGSISSSVFKEYKNPLTNKEFYDAMWERGVAQSSWSRAESYTQLANKYRTRTLDLILPGEGRISSGIKGGARIGEAINRANLEHVGRHVEDNAKFMVAIDYLKRNVKKGAEITSKDLDNAAYHALQSLFDYGDFTPLESSLRNFIPFYAWHKNIIKSTFKNLVKNPARMARQGRFYDFMFTPLTEGERQDAKEWMTQQGAVTGTRLFGQFPKTAEGLPSVLTVGRAIPQQEVSALLTDPYQTLMGWLMPLYRWPFEAIPNKSVYWGGPIDMGVEKEPESHSWLDWKYGNALVNPIKSALGMPAPYASREQFLGWNRPDAWQHAFETFTPFARVARQADVLGETIGAAAGDMPILGALKDKARPAMTAPEYIANFLTGGKFYGLDLDRSRNMKEHEITQHIQNLKALRRWAGKKGREDEVQRYTQVMDDLMRELQSRRASAITEPAN